MHSKSWFDFDFDFILSCVDFYVGKEGEEVPNLTGLTI